MKILVDECVYKITTDFLRQQSGCEVITVKEIGLKSYPDEDILEYARKHHLISVSNDSDFSNIPSY